MGAAPTPLFADGVTSPERRAEYERRGLWDDSTLARRVLLHASTTPDGTAVVDDRGRRTRRQLCDDAGAFGGWLADAGVRPATVVSVQLPNWYEFVVAAVAVQSLGAVINPLLPNYRARELANVFRTARPVVMVSPAEYRGQNYGELLAEVSASTGVSPRSVVVGGDPSSGATDFASAMEAGRGSSLATGSAPAISETTTLALPELRFTVMPTWVARPPVT